MKQSKTFYGWWIVLGSAIILAMLGPAPVAIAIFSKHPLQRNLIYQIVNLRLVIHLFLGWASFYLPSFQDN